LSVHNAIIPPPLPQNHLLPAPARPVNRIH
jgi:hypothetical protein